VVGTGDLLPDAAGPPQRAAAPQPLDLRLVAAWVRELSLFDHDVWANLEAHTEAAWVARALAGDWPTWTRHDGQVLELVCCPNLDLHTGGAGWYRERHGNLRADGGQAVLGRALAQGGRSTMHCGLIPTRCRRLPSWPRGMAAVTAGGGRGQQPAWGGIGHVSNRRSGCESYSTKAALWS
jgi:hypothetical protein